MAMWDAISNALGSGGVAQAQEGQVAPGKTDWNMWSSILGRGAQAMTAGDPQSWQHQLGGLGAQLGQAGKMSMIQEAEKKRKEAFNNMLLKAFGLNINQGETKFGTPTPTSTQPKAEDPFGLGSLTMNQNPVFKELGGWQ